MIRAAHAREGLGCARWFELARAAVLLGCLGLAACRTGPVPRAPPPAAAPVVSAPAQHYHIDAARSQVLILVYRDGPMARLGHNHVLSVRELAGEVLVAPALPGSSFSLEFPVAALAIDDPGLRAQGGDDFKEPIDAAGIEGTRSHLLGEQLLDAARYPDIRVVSAGLRPEADHWLVRLHITVRDHDCTAEVPMSFAATGDELSASGEFDLTHTQLGLTPYSVALGALRVAETLHIRYHVIARLAGASAGSSENP